jgi:signal transduction histidine kinase/phage shock protein PspC (stress-responsive transcriptional regulator)
MSQPVVEPRRAFREPEGRLVAGVGTGLARHLGVTPLSVRVGFIALMFVSGLGVLLYGAFWALLPVRAESHDALAPGLAAASRRGLRTRYGTSTPADLGVALSVCLVGLGAVVFLQNAGLGVSPRVFYPLLVAAAGAMLLWWQSDEAGRASFRDRHARWQAWLRVGSGLLLVSGAAWLALWQAHLGSVSMLGAVIGLALLGVSLVIGPWLLRLSRDLQEERSERIRSEERADVAAHLHDSVLQTLALIQRQAGDPQTVVQLARTQERELRTWLFEPAESSEATVRLLLQQAAADVEESHRVPVELVVVGDTGIDEGIRALVAASREAMVNAARHAGADRIDVFAEVQSDRVEVGVRDRGRGFDLAAVPSDRRGVRGSIVERMARHGGRAEITTSPESGTEVRMWVPLANQQEMS